MKFVSGALRPVGPGFEAVDLRKKYCTCDPGVSIPSGMILVNSLVVSVPSQPDPAPYAAQSPATPAQLMLVELVKPLGITITQRFLVIHSVAKFGSLSCIMPAQLPCTLPHTLALLPVRNRFSSMVSIRALFQVFLFQPPEWLPAPNGPGLAM